MKDDINLLPPGLKSRRRRRILLQHVGGLLRRLTMVAGVTVVLLGITLMLLRHQVTQLSGSKEASTVSDDVDASVRSTNTFLQALDAHQSQIRPWTPQVQEVLQALPSGALLSTLSVDEATDTLLLAGSAPSRATVAAVEQKLRELPWVKDVAAPLKNLAGGTLSRFEVKISRQTMP